MKEVLKQVVVEKENVVKLNSKEFKEKIERFSKEKNVSKRQARKKIFWQTIESQKNSTDLSKPLKSVNSENYSDKKKILLIQAKMCLNQHHQNIFSK